MAGIKHWQYHHWVWHAGICWCACKKGRVNEKTISGTKINGFTLVKKASFLRLASLSLCKAALPCLA